VNNWAFKERETGEHQELTDRVMERMLEKYPGIISGDIEKTDIPNKMVVEGIKESKVHK
jgi:hypothetical protein